MDNGKNDYNFDDIFGMDVMGALNKLVQSATVGGKKDKAPEPKPEDPVENLAKDVYHFFTAFMKVGFSEDQAFELAEMLLSSLLSNDE